VSASATSVPSSSKLIRAKRHHSVVAPPGDAQKLFRKSYVTNGLVCGRNPKRVATETGHRSVRMIMDQYELFTDEESWPDDSEVRRLAAFYGWTDTRLSDAARGPKGEREATTGRADETA
jgi:hypothetical protein